MLVVHSLPNIYEKFKARWIKEKKSSIDLWNRLNNDNFTPLTLAADLHRVQMFHWLLDERKKVHWSYGDVFCVLHPLDQLDYDFYDEYLDADKRPLCVLEIIIKNNDSELVHPILTSLVDKKWKYFVYRQLRARFLIAFIYLIIFLLTTILEQSNRTSESVCRQVCYRIGHTIVIAETIFKSIREINEMSTLGFRNYINTTVKQNVFFCRQTLIFLVCFPGINFPR